MKTPLENAIEVSELISQATIAVIAGDNQSALSALETASALHGEICEHLTNQPIPPKATES